MGIVALLMLTGALWYVLATRFADQMPSGPVRLSVVTTFYPLEEFARAVGGERVTVTSIVPPGTEPHEYEPTQKDILSIYQADIFLLNGAGLDAWAEKIRPELERRGIRVIQMSETVELLPGVEEEDEEEHVDARHEESFFDPHFWLDPLLAEQEVLAVRNALITRDNSGKAIYDTNSKRYIKELQVLHEAYQKRLGACTLHTVVTSHNAFSYLAKRYSFDTLPVSGLSPEGEVSTRRLAEIARIVQEKNIKHIFFETLVSPKVAETLAAEVDAETLVFNPIEGLTDEERAAGMNYVSIMKSNLDNLQTALQCQL